MNLAQPLVNVAAHLFQSELVPDKKLKLVKSVQYRTQTTQFSPVIEILHFALVHTQGRKRKEFGGNKCLIQARYSNI